MYGCAHPGNTLAPSKSAFEELKQKKLELADALFDETAAPNFSSDDLLSLLEG